MIGQQCVHQSKEAGSVSNDSPYSEWLTFQRFIIGKFLRLSKRTTVQLWTDRQQKHISQQIALSPTTRIYGLFLSVTSKNHFTERKFKVVENDQKNRNLVFRDFAPQNACVQQLRTWWTLACYYFGRNAKWYICSLVVRLKVDAYANEQLLFVAYCAYYGFS